MPFPHCLLFLWNPCYYSPHIHTAGAPAAAEGDGGRTEESAAEGKRGLYRCYTFPNVIILT